MGGRMSAPKTKKTTWNTLNEKPISGPTHLVQTVSVSTQPALSAEDNHTNGNNRGASGSSSNPLKDDGTPSLNPPRNHPYDEVSDEYLSANRQAHPPKQPRNHPYDEVSDEYLSANRQAHSPKSTRNHPYDEVSDAHLSANRQAQSPKSTRNHPYDEVSDAHLSDNRQVHSLVPCRDHPYDNISEDHFLNNRQLAAANADHRGLATGRKKSENSEESSNHSGGADYLDDNVLDLYAKVNKPKKPTNDSKDSMQSPSPTLNYIEVAVLPPDPEVKRSRSRSPCAYTNVVQDHGKLVLLSE